MGSIPVWEEGCLASTMTPCWNGPDMPGGGVPGAGAPRREISRVRDSFSPGNSWDRHVCHGCWWDSTWGAHQMYSKAGYSLLWFAKHLEPSKISH